ncbi:GGDEF domain-containing protein [Colwellia sp. 6_MG-2023]|uniref:GGDEF domain-containing protein n=1 Tax=Colwellia sp. 6_MG-2023 TaxID=3062676 RepID=UPI0026E190C1|nr:GGDEF domain-containing protein [Colwellia sp. 6_MG-2023]MDO6487304.1 GGDEF domain-containing protein [Colwellia sp. 6_MG-2023]
MLNNLDQNLQYRRSVMRVMLLLVMVGGATFSVINFYRGLWSLAILEMIFAFFAFFLWRKILYISNFQRWVSIFLLPFFTTMVYAMYVPNTSVSIFVWIIAIPMISYLMMGRVQGFWVSIFFIVSGVSVYHYRFIEGNSVIDIADSLNIILGACLMISLAHVYEVNREKNEERLLELASTDTLTGLANRMKLKENFTLYAEYAKRHKSSLAVAIFDLDYFKKINDEHGHHVGDATLCYIANFIKDRVRKTDLLARFGGEEFVLLIVGSKDQDCYKQVDSLRQQLQDTPFIYDEVTLAMTVSAGIATYGNDGLSLDDLLLKADRRLYLAKDNGRNCVVDGSKESEIKNHN